MGDHLEALVRERANRRCEYRRFPEAYAELPFQFDHIIARQHGGDKEVENLPLRAASAIGTKVPISPEWIQRPMKLHAFLIPVAKIGMSTSVGQER